MSSESPVLDATWAGLVDLRRSPELAHSLAEVAELPGLAAALMRLNAAESPVWTAKCDVWQVPDAVELDVYELDAEPGSIKAAVACYLDLLPRVQPQWSDLALVVAECKSVCGRLQGATLTHSRVDLIVRRAIYAPYAPDAPKVAGLGITAYLTACSETVDGANQRLGEALEIFCDALVVARR